MKIRSFLKKTIGPKNIQTIRNIGTYALWKLTPRPVAAHGLFKRKIFKQCRRNHNLNVFVETGTAGGGTVLALRKHFKKLYSIELDPTLYQEGKEKTKPYSNIICLEGDSGMMLVEVLKELREPALFWLDAHYSGHGTARAAIDTPIAEELRKIFSHGIKNHVIVIDDMRLFDGTNSYPILAELKEFIAGKAPHHLITEKHDLLIIEPK